MCAPNFYVCVCSSSRLVRARTRAQLIENIGANPAHWSGVEGHIICLVPIAYTCGTITPAVIVHCVERKESDSVSHYVNKYFSARTEKQNPGGASAPSGTCMRAP